MFGIFTLDKIENVLPNEEYISLESISKLTNSLAHEMDSAIKTIQDINEETHILALNAAIEASSAGDAGKGFGVVADHMGNLSNETGHITKKMSQKSQNKIIELEEILTTQATRVRGERLANLALTNIDLIDRSFYERSADVRWWAKDKSIVNSLEDLGQNPLTVSRRLNTILKFYTIYDELIVTDLRGIIIANGNPRYNLVGKDVSKQEWFTNILQTKNGEEFEFSSIHRSPQLDNDIVVTFSCKVHQDGDPSKQAIGVFASVFSWNKFTQKIIQSTPINEEDREKTRICIIDNDRKILADSQNNLFENLEINEKEKLFSEPKNFLIHEKNQKKIYIAHAASPGFENFSTGWHSIIMQD